MSEMERPPETLRELFGPVVTGTATAMFLLWLAVFGWTVLVVCGSLIRGKPADAAFALVELIPACVAVALFGSIVTGIMFAITGMVRRMRARTTA